MKDIGLYSSDLIVVEKAQEDIIIAETDGEFTV